MGSKITQNEFTGLVEEVLQRLARDPKATHLWHWQARPDCADEPAGRSRRNHLGTLLGLLGGVALGGSAACGDSGGGNTDTKVAKEAGVDGPVGDMPPVCGDDPCAVDIGPKPDKPKPCADDPCACGDDPCACADDPCAVDLGPKPDVKPSKPDGMMCGDDPCACADDPCACADDPCSGP